jgi:hypothetical protein
MQGLRSGNRPLIRPATSADCCRIPDSRPQTAERRNNLAITRNSVADRAHSVENPPSDERRNGHTDDRLVRVAKKMLQPAFPHHGVRAK